MPEFPKQIFVQRHEDSDDPYLVASESYESIDTNDVGTTVAVVPAEGGV